MSLFETTHNFMLKANVYKFIWPKVVNTFAYISTILPTRSNLGITHEGVYSWIKPNLSHLHIFGYKVFVHVPKQKRNKLQVKVHIGIFVGFDEMTKGYWCYNLEKRKVMISHDVTVDETTFML
jgi:hypothetical protein